MERESKARSEVVSPVVGAEVRQNVVIRYANGRLARGFVSREVEIDLKQSVSEVFNVEGLDGKPVEVRAGEIKAVFFVRSFEGNPNYQEFKVFGFRPTGKGVWVRVQFKDGETLEGVAPNCFETYSKPVFYMTPPDPSSNNRAVLVSKRSLKEMQVLGIASD